MTAKKKPTKATLSVAQRNAQIARAAREWADGMDPEDRRWLVHSPDLTNPYRRAYGPPDRSLLLAILPVVEGRARK